jgi:predicted anti-sigma-YlaC factor YlaD
MTRHGRNSGWLLLTAACALALGTACSIKKLAINKLGDAMAESGATYASDDDPTLVREALPFALKLIESLLDQSPRHRGLLLAAAGGFTQYTYAFVQEEADEKEDEDLEAAAALRERARKLYLRARDYGLRGMEVRHEGFAAALRAESGAAAGPATREDVPLLYWTATAWGAAIAMKKDDPDLLADLPIVEVLMKQGLALDPEFDHGAIHEFLIALEGGRSDAMGGSVKRAREHFEEAVRLSEGLRAAPLVGLAETVSVRLQDRAEFEALLKRALLIDVNARPEWRLANLVMQRRARWLLARTDLLFAE